jgi:WD40 repeat protein/serine/threonine protein kinase
MMDPTKWRRIEGLLHQALELNVELRRSFLERECGSDAELCRYVATLLEKENQAVSFLETPLLAHLDEPGNESSASSLIGQYINHYRIHSLIGAGGMGEVYRAYDENLSRTVAIKILPRIFTIDPDRVRRFEQEALTVSRLNHPNIITIFEIVRRDGLHFIASEFVEGQTLRQLLSAGGSGEPRVLELPQVLEISIQVAKALKAAHTAWIIHRDIKPENIMMRSDGLVKVLDFGIAKLEHVPDSPPVIKEDLAKARFPILESPAYQPDSAHSLTIPGTIMGTASYMAPEQARGEQLDGRADLFSLGMVMYEMASGKRLAIVHTGGNLKSKTAEDRVLFRPKRLDGISKRLERIIRRATLPEREERYGSAGEMLHALEALKHRLENRPSRRIARASLAALVVIVGLATFSGLLSRSQEWDEAILRDGHTAAVRRAVFSPDGRLLVSVGEDKQVIVWDFARRERLRTFLDHTETVNAVAFSPDGKLFVTASDDQSVIVWDATRLERVITLSGHRGPVRTIAFSPDGRRLISAAGKPGVAILWDTRSWKAIKEWSWLSSYGNFVFLKHGDQFADTTGRIRSVDTGELLRDVDPRWGGNWAVMSPDGKLRGSVDTSGDLKVIDIRDDKLIASEHGHDDHGRSIAFSPDGRLLASAADCVVLWNAETLSKIANFEYESIVWSVAFSPDGRWLVSTHGDGAILIWDVQRRERVANLREHSGGVRAVAFSPDGKWIASTSDDHSVIIWDTDGRQKMAVLQAHRTRVTAAAFDPTSQWLVTSDQNGIIIRWNIRERAPELTINAPAPATPSYCLAISPDRRWIAATHGVYSIDQGHQVLKAPPGDLGTIYGAVFTPDSRRLICVTDQGYVLVWDTQSWAMQEKVHWSDLALISVSLSPDGKYLVTGDDGKMVRLGSVAPLQQLSVLGRHDARIKSVAFSPDGSSVASAGDDKTIALWNVNRRQLITHIGTHTSPVYAIAFSPDGRRCVSGEHDHSVRLYSRHRTLWGFRFD